METDIGDKYKMNLCFLVGLSGSGKTALAEKLKRDKDNVIIVSSDSERKELYGFEEIQGDNSLLFNKLHEKVLHYLENGKNIVFDSTGLNRKYRRNLINKLPKNIEKKCIIVATDYDTCLERNNNRDRHVPEEVIKRQRESFQIPSYSEGWDKIEILFNDYDESKYTLSKLEGLMFGFEQDNPHHSMDLWRHGKAVADKFTAPIFLQDTLYYWVGILHDAGKVYSKVFHNMRGEETEIAHYYNHSEIGSYESMFYLDNYGYTVDEILNACLLVQYHMRPYEMKTDKSKQKFINEFGQELYDRLIILHQADEESH